MRRLLSLTAIAAAALATASPSFAAIVTFQISEIGGPESFIFTVDQTPVPDYYDDLSFTLFAVDVTWRGQPGNFFFIAFGATDLSLGANTHFSVSPAMFTGPTSSPTFLTGGYHLSLQGPPRDPPHYTMTISQVSPVPEPATWAMMLLGFASTGLIMRRNRKMIRDQLRPA